MSDGHFAEAIARTFDLGTPNGEMTRVAGGLTHRMWRVETDRGTFAVKDLNIAPDGPWTPERLERAFERFCLFRRFSLCKQRPPPCLDACLPSAARRELWVLNSRVRESNRC
jgi:hypothetical protein